MFVTSVAFILHFCCSLWNSFIVQYCNVHIIHNLSQMVGGISKPSVFSAALSLLLVSKGFSLHCLPS